MALAIAESKAFSLAGGGDTLAGHRQIQRDRAYFLRFDRGGAFLEFLEGKTLPAVAMLEARAKK